MDGANRQAIMEERVRRLEKTTDKISSDIITLQSFPLDGNRNRNGFESLKEQVAALEKDVHKIKQSSISIMRGSKSELLHSYEGELRELNDKYKNDFRYSQEELREQFSRKLRRDMDNFLSENNDHMNAEVRHQVKNLLKDNSKLNSEINKYVKDMLEDEIDVFLKDKLVDTVFQKQFDEKIKKVDSKIDKSIDDARDRIAVVFLMSSFSTLGLCLGLIFLRR